MGDTGDGFSQIFDIAIFSYVGRKRMNTEIRQVIPWLVFQQCCEDRVTLYYQFVQKVEAT